MAFHKWFSAPRQWRALKSPARKMRSESTDAEAALWERLRNRQLQGYKFRRQHAAGRFILDFYCPEAHLGVELDGPIHARQQEEDEARTKFLSASGIIVLRFGNEQVMKNADEVLRTITDALESNKKASKQN